MNSTLLMDAREMQIALNRMAHEIADRCPNHTRLALVGVESRGVPIALRLASLLQEVVGCQVPVGRLDISLYRDDFESRRPEVRTSDIPFDMEGAHVVLVDDVLYTGRTTRAAIGALVEFGRPASIRLAVLVDRGGRELPIQPDFAGRIVQTRPGERIRVEFLELDGADCVALEKPGSPA
jgi:pyrimidine operon attenuation protein/uracil phosphoribosyltransferase